MKYTNFVKEKLATGQPVIGIWSIINSPITVDIAAHAGLDFQILDMEHGVYDTSSLENCVRAAESMRCSPLVRVSGLQPALIQNCIDAGAHGIIVPQQQTYQNVLDVVQACKLPPDGSRGFNPFTRANGYNPAMPITDSRLHNQFGLTSVILENKNIFTELDRVLQIPDLDILYLGIYDLSCDLGHRGDIHHPEVNDYVNDAVKRIKSGNKYSALMVHNANDIEKYLKLGVNCLVYGVDTHIYHHALTQRISEFKKQFTGSTA